MQGQPNFATFLGGNGNIGLESRRLASMAREVRIAESAVFIYSFIHLCIAVSLCQDRLGTHRTRDDEICRYVM